MKQETFLKAKLVSVEDLPRLVFIWLVKTLFKFIQISNENHQKVFYNNGMRIMGYWNTIKYK